jgi:succinyl-diaminopimelate desuccinylase
VDHDSVVNLTRELVRIPSKAGTDPYGSVLERMSAWLAGHGLTPRLLSAPGIGTVAMVCEVNGSQPGPRDVLDACLDTRRRRRCAGVHDSDEHLVAQGTAVTG